LDFLYILLALFIFGVLIFIHELGHFVVARLCGVKILEFAIGMGPKVISHKSKKSGIVYSLRLIPLGGFVSMWGENGMEAVQGSQPETPDGTEQKDGFFFNTENINDNRAEETIATINEEDAKQMYSSQSVWKRMLISLAGPAMNVFLGILLMLVIVIASGGGNVGNTVVANFHVVYTSESEHEGLLKGDYILALNQARVDSYQQLKASVEADDDGVFDLVVHRLQENGSDEIVELNGITLNMELLNSSFTSSLSEQSGLQKGDEIKKINNTRVHTAHELTYEISNQGYRPMTFTVLRNGEEVLLENVIVPSFVDSGATFGNMDFRVYAEPEFDFKTVLKHTWYRSVSTVKMVFDSLFGLFSGRYGVEAVSGPVGITKTISDVAKMGWLNLLHLVTVISINLGVMNLLPFPALDGGHLLIYVIEAIRRKPLKREVEGMINFIGLVIILTLAVLIMIKDFIAL
jgi:regulator of sigma E protease